MPTRDLFDRAISRSKKVVVGMTTRVSLHGGGGEEGGGEDDTLYSSALAAAEDLVLRIGSGRRTYDDELDIYALAGDVAYYADGADVFLGHTWRWDDGRGDLIERMYSAAETEARVVVSNDAGCGPLPVSSSFPPSPEGMLSRLIRKCREGMIDVLGSATRHDEDGPFTIFGLRCAVPSCGGGGGGRIGVS